MIFVILLLKDMSFFAYGIIRSTSGPSIMDNKIMFFFKISSALPHLVLEMPP